MELSKKRKKFGLLKKRRLNKFAFEKNLLRSSISFLGSRLRDVYSFIPYASQKKSSNSSNSDFSKKSSEKKKKSDLKHSRKKSSEKQKILSKKISSVKQKILSLKKSSNTSSLPKISIKRKRKRSVERLITKKKKLNSLKFSSYTTKNGIPNHKDAFKNGFTKWEMSYDVNFNKSGKKRTHDIYLIQNITITIDVKSNPDKFTISDMKKNINGQWDPLVFTKNDKKVNENKPVNGIYKAFYTELFKYGKSPSRLDRSGYKDMFPVNPWIFSPYKNKSDHNGRLSYSVYGEIFQVSETKKDTYNLGKFRPAGILKAREGHIDKSEALGDIRTRFIEYDILDNHVKKISLRGSDNKDLTFKDDKVIISDDMPEIEELELIN